MGKTWEKTWEKKTWEKTWAIPYNGVFMRNYFLWVIPTLKNYCDKVVILPVSFGQNLPPLSNWFDESGRFSSSSPSTYPNGCWQLHVRCYPPLIWTICSKSRPFFSHVVPSSYKFLCNSHINHKPQWKIGYSDITGHQLELVSVTKTTSCQWNPHWFWAILGP